MNCDRCHRTIPDWYDWHVCMPAKRDLEWAARIDPGIALAQKGDRHDRDTGMVHRDRGGGDRTRRAAHIARTLIAVIGFVAVSVCYSGSRADGRTTRPSDNAAVVSQAQMVLASYGYTVTSQRQLDRAVRHWQRANALTVDGIIGPETQASLGVGPETGPGPAPTPAGGGPDPESIIREIWPDDVENEAVRIATRESRLQPDARNACCYGLFQIHYRAHRAWLTQYGVTGPADLLDARTNATVALALYEQAGWGPWAL